MYFYASKKKFLSKFANISFLGKYHTIIVLSVVQLIMHKSYFSSKIKTIVIDVAAAARIRRKFEDGPSSLARISHDHDIIILTVITI